MKLSDFLKKAIDIAFNDANIDMMDQYIDAGDITDRFFALFKAIESC